MMLRISEQWSDRLDGDTSQYIPHPNLAFQPNNRRAGPHPVNVYNDLVLFDPRQEERFPVKIAFLQLLHAVFHLHSHWNIIHGAISSRYVYITKTKSRLVLILPSTLPKREIATEDDTVQDVVALRKLFDTILTDERKEKENKVALILIDDLLQMMTTTACIAEFLKHPYFWSPYKSFNFLGSVTQFSKSNQGNRLKRMLDANETFQTVCTEVDDWKDCLLLDSEELDRYKNELCKHTGKREAMIRRETVKKRAETQSGAGKFNYDGTRIQSLLNFIRNKAEHFHEDSNKVQACFQYNNAEGILDFFNHRFPNLFKTVYECFCRYRKERNDCVIARRYFTIAENMDYAHPNQ